MFLYINIPANNGKEMTELEYHHFTIPALSYPLDCCFWHLPQVALLDPCWKSYLLVGFGDYLCLVSCHDQEGQLGRQKRVQESAFFFAGFQALPDKLNSITAHVVLVFPNVCFCIFTWFHVFKSGLSSLLFINLIYI